MADTHGSVADLEVSIVALKKAGADALIHLGDFCDSVRTGRLEDIIAMLIRENVAAVMGNNDFQILNRLKSNSLDLPNRSRETVLAFLRSTPVIRNIDGICFAHSLPYDNIRSFYEPIDDGTVLRAADIFSESPHRVIFCGHSHLPALFVWHAGVVTRQASIAKRIVPFVPENRYIIVVGSPSSGECGIYDSGRHQYERVLLDI